MKPVAQLLLLLLLTYGVLSQNESDFDCDVIVVGGSAAALGAALAATDYDLTVRKKTTLQKKI